MSAATPHSAPLPHRCSSRPHAAPLCRTLPQSPLLHSAAICRSLLNHSPVFSLVDAAHELSAALCGLSASSQIMRREAWGWSLKNVMQHLRAAACNVPGLPAFHPASSRLAALASLATSNPGSAAASSVAVTACPIAADCCLNPNPILLKPRFRSCKL
jgi:hypothetical protein